MSLFTRRFVLPLPFYRTTRLLTGKPYAMGFPEGAPLSCEQLKDVAVESLQSWDNSSRSFMCIFLITCEIANQELADS